MNTESLPEVSLDDIRAVLAEQLVGAAESSPLPLSSAQEQLWFLDQLEPGSPRYNIPNILWLKGGLNATALETALRAIIGRHESLRAHFISNEGEPEQIIASENEFVLLRQDLLAVPASERDHMAKQLIEEEVCRPFDLSRELPIRVKLLKLGEREHVLIVNMHHIISDEWSFRIFYRELETVYTALLQGAAPNLPELPIQYADYVAWQKEWLESGEFQEHLEFWKKHLGNNPSPVNLPTDRPRRYSANPRGALEIRRLPPEFRQEIHQLARRTRVTPFVVLLAGLKALLHAYTGQTEIVVGSPMACRNQEETENVIGSFANNLPLSTQVSGELTFEQLLSRVREGVLGAYSNQHMPFDKLVELLQPQRAAGQTPFISVLFLFQNDFGAFELPGLQITFLDASTNTAKFDVTVVVSDEETELALEAEYNAELFDAGTMKAFLSNYEKLLRAMVSEPTRRIPEIPLDLQPGVALLPDWTPPPQDAPVWEFFERWFELRREQSGGFSNGIPSPDRSNTADIPASKRGGEPPAPPEPGAELQSAESLRSILRAMLEEPRESSLVEIQPEGSKPPLFLVHGAGGGMFWGYSNLAHHFGMDQPVYGFKSRGLEGENELESIEALAGSYLADLRAFQPRGPYRLGGYCFGGTVAYEMARRLTAEGEAVEFLGLMNSTAPNSRYLEFSWTPRSSVQFAVNVLRRFYYSARAHPAQIPGFLFWKMRSLIKPAMKSVAGSSDEGENSQNDVGNWIDLSPFNAAERRVWRAHYVAACNYFPQPYSGRVWLFRSPVHLLRCSFEADYGWSKFASGGLTVKIIHCAHEAILEEPTVHSLASAMQQYLA